MNSATGVSLLALVVLVTGCEKASNPSVSADQAKSSLCVHVKGIPAAQGEDPGLASIIEALEVDRRLLAAAGETDTAEVVEETIDALQRGGARSIKVSIFLLPDATEQERDALAALLDDDPAVASSEYMSREQAYEEFVELYRDQPEFFEDLPRDALPNSFRIETEPGTDVDDFVAQFPGMPGIDDVRTETGLAQIAEPIRRLLELCGDSFP